MTILEVKKYPDKRLMQKAKIISNSDQFIKKELNDMLETMYVNKAIGLAATQVGINKRAIVIDLKDGRKKNEKPYKIINPKIIWVSKETTTMQEGCISIPYYSIKITRPSSLKLEYIDEYGEKIILLANGLMAACIQHEVDHLNGILSIHYLSSLKRNMLIRRLMKDKRKIESKI